ncbi:MAG: hypothetical protein JOZ47_19725 [Kutzneria sp.]|nr:hypothetical protein [Kutzneria sp.]
MRIAVLVPALAGSLALTTGLVAGPAGAQAAVPATHGAIPQHAISHHPRAGGSGNGRLSQDGGNWSGYVATGGTFTSASLSWTEPSADCGGAGGYNPMDTLVGIGGYHDQQSFPVETGVSVQCDHPNGPVYWGLFQSNSDGRQYYMDLPISPGDSFTASVTKNGGGNEYMLTLTDHTKGWTKATPVSDQLSNSSVEAVNEYDSPTYVKYGAVHFTGFSVNGKDASSFEPTALETSNLFYYVDHTSGLSGGDFSITQSPNPAQPPPSV